MMELHHAFGGRLMCPKCGTEGGRNQGVSQEAAVEGQEGILCVCTACDFEWRMVWEREQLESSKNTNCLEGIECPECGHTEEFEINGHVWATVTDDGVTENENFEWDAGSTCRCVKCNHRDRMDAFGDLDADTNSVGCDALPARDRRDSDKLEAGRCPVCDCDEDQSYGSFDNGPSGSNCVGQSVNCGHCGTRYQEVYALDDRVVLEKGDLIEQCEAEQMRTLKKVRDGIWVDRDTCVVARALLELVEKELIKPLDSAEPFQARYEITEAGRFVLSECVSPDDVEDEGSIRKRRPNDTSSAEQEPEEAQPELDRYRGFVEVVAAMKPHIGMFFSTELRELITSAKDLTK